MIELRKFYEELVKRVGERDRSTHVEITRSISLQPNGYDVMIHSENTGRTDAYHMYKNEYGDWDFIVFYYQQ